MNTISEQLQHARWMVKKLVYTVHNFITKKTYINYDYFKAVYNHCWQAPHIDAAAIYNTPVACV
jgi:hypothetical protein